PLRILVVDDEEAIRTILIAFLDVHEVSAARDGREAIALLAEREFDLVLCDLMMPGLTGMDVYDHACKAMPGSEARIVFMTGGAVTDRARAFVQTIESKVLYKPFSP